MFYRNMKTTFYQTLIVLVISCGAYSVTNKTVGDEIILGPGSKVENIIGITWKHDRNIVAEWYKVKPDCCRQLKGHYKLDTTTGNLTIVNLTLEDSGIYIAEINNKVLDPTELKVFSPVPKPKSCDNTTQPKVISPVPKPTVSMSCDNENTHCVLTCEVNTTGVGPVNYTWWSDNKIIHETKQLNITKEEINSGFICEVKNPVNSNSSEIFINPFITNKKQSSLIIAAISTLLVVAVGVCVGVVLYKHKRRGRRVCVRTNEHDCEMVRVAGDGADQGSSNQGQTSSGQTSSVHLENETETMNDRLLGENNDATVPPYVDYHTPQVPPYVDYHTPQVPPYVDYHTPQVPPRVDQHAAQGPSIFGRPASPLG